MKKQHSPACERNQVPILNVLRNHLNSKARILEIASGTGQHAAFFTSQMRGWIWQASDVEDDALNSIQAYREDGANENFLEPLRISTCDEAWNIGKFDAALCCNMIHISPWESCQGLFKHLSQHLVKDGTVFLYGPFIQDGLDTAPSNLAFDASLRSRDPKWGIRNLTAVAQEAKSHNFIQQQIYEMPANNLCVIFRKGV